MSAKKTEQKKIIARTPEERENHMIALAIDKVEERMLSGKASSQEYVHYLKLAATREKTALEREKLALERDLIQAKTEMLRASGSNNELYEQAIAALGEYRGDEPDDDYTY